MRADDLLDVDSISVPAVVLQRTVAHLKECGDCGLEGVAFWAGRLEGTRFRVTEAVIPRQHAMVDARSGVGVAIDGDELFRLNVWLYKARLQLIAQIHSHPGSAYHSTTDDAMSVVTRAGSLSIVVPDFAARGLELSTIAAHRLARDGRWKELTRNKIERLLKLQST